MTWKFTELSVKAIVPPGRRRRNASFPKPTIAFSGHSWSCIEIRESEVHVSTNLSHVEELYRKQGKQIFGTLYFFFIRDIPEIKIPQALEVKQLLHLLYHFQTLANHKKTKTTFPEVILQKCQGQNATIKVQFHMNYQQICNLMV